MRDVAATERDADGLRLCGCGAPAVTRIGRGVLDYAADLRWVCGACEDAYLPSDDDARKFADAALRSAEIDAAVRRKLEEALQLLEEFENDFDRRVLCRATESQDMDDGAAEIVLRSGARLAVRGEKGVRAYFYKTPCNCQCCRTREPDPFDLSVSARRSIADLLEHLPAVRSERARRGTVGMLLTKFLGIQHAKAAKHLGVSERTLRAGMAEAKLAATATRGKGG